MKSKTINLFVMVAAIALSATPPKASPSNRKPSLSSMEERFRNAAKSAQVIRVSGYTTLWKKTTGLDWSVGFTLNSKATQRLLMQNFRCIDQRRHLDESFDKGSIDVDFMEREADGGYGYLHEFQYYRRGKQAYWQEAGTNVGPYQIVVPVRPGYGRRFEAFVRSLVKRAKSHDHSVSYFQVPQGD